MTFPQKFDMTTHALYSRDKLEYIKRLFLGRLNRRTFVLGEALYFLLLYLIIANAKIMDSLPLIAQYMLGLITSGIVFSFQLSLLSRRLHGLGKDDLEYRFPFFHTSQVSVIFGFFVPGEKVENQYGKPPKTQIDIKALFGIQA